jgi:hypothetical protein
MQAWVARWLVFEPKIPIWVNFGGSCDGRCWCILWPFGLFDGHLAIFYGILEYFMVIWYISTVLISFSKKNLATLIQARNVVKQPDSVKVLRNEAFKQIFLDECISGVDVMITIFCDFCQFSAKKLSFFLNTNVMINFFQNLALF